MKEIDREMVYITYTYPKKKKKNPDIEIKANAEPGIKERENDEENH